MKLLLALVALCVSVAIGVSETWTIHGARENWMVFAVRHWNFPNQQIRVIWNYHNFPYEQQSGFYNSIYSDTEPILLSYSEILEHRDTWIFDAPSGSIGICESLWGGNEEYYGWWSYPFGWPYTFADWIQTPGEYWIDFESGGIPRLSTSIPSDFGKWLWDGSINPNYVEPLILSKSKIRKHRK